MFKYLLIYCFCLFGLSVAVEAANSYKLIDLGLEQTDMSEAIAVNDYGLVLGSYHFHGKGYFFLWDKDQGMRVIDIPQGYQPKVLNNNGEIAGEYILNGKSRGFIWNLSQGVSDIGTLGGDSTEVCDMNDLGQIVGTSRTNLSAYNGAGNTPHAYLWENGNMIDLGTLIGEMGIPSNWSEAVGINNHGQIIGRSHYMKFYKGRPLGTKPVGVIWENLKIRNLDPRISNLDLELTPWSINDSGLIVCKEGFLIDLKNNEKISISSTAIRKINNNGYMLTEKGLCHFENLNEGVNPYRIFDSIKSNNWKCFNVFRGFNKNNWIVGIGLNIYGESHAVIMIPIKE